jgi:tryptophanyl-tRNA synthetase
MGDDGKILVSGVKPTGRPHLGNYLGAMKQFVDLQNDYKSFVFIADLHTLTTLQNADELRENSIEMAIDYLTIGVNPEITTLYKQSDVPQVAELGWILNCITTMPYLMRAHAFKDAEAKNKEINVGVFGYPLLMAADILIQDADIVPVGLDQKQHIEITRDTADKFNRIYGEAFKLPQPFLMDAVKTLPGTDGQKMSKSYKNTIPLFANDSEIKSAVMSIPTDSKGIEEPKDPHACKVFGLHKFFTVGTEFDDLQERYESGGIGYKESKEILLKNISKFILPLREKRERIASDRDYVRSVLEEGGKKARARAEIKMEEVRERVGLSFSKS